MALRDHRQAGRGEHQIGRRPRCIGGAANGDADIGLLQRRRVVDPVAGHADDVAGALQRLDDLELVLGEDAGEAIRRLDRRQRIGRHAIAEDRVGDDDVGAELELTGNLLRDRLVIAGDHLDVDAHRFGCGDGGGTVVARRVEQRQEAEELPCAGRVRARHAERAQALPGFRIDLCGNCLLSLPIQLAQIDDDLRRPLGDREGLAILLDVGLGPLVDRVEGPEGLDLVGVERLHVRKAGEDGAVDGIGRIAFRGERRRGEQVGARDPGSRRRVAEGELVLGERAGLVRAQYVHARHLFDGDQTRDDSASCAPASRRQPPW